MLYAVICELKNRWKNYSSLVQKIESYGTWMHYIDNVWVIETWDNADKITEDLLPLIDQDKDSLLIMRLAREAQGWLPKEAWEWMSERNV